MFMPEIIIPTRNELFEFAIHGDKGWHFGAGNPEWWEHQSELLVHGGKLLDVGIGDGRSSLYFAINGMKITGYETVPSKLEDFEQMVSDLSDVIAMDIDLRLRDFAEEETLSDQFDTVLVDHALNHQPSLEDGHMLLDKAFDALKVGGHIFIRTYGIDDSNYEKLASEAERGFVLQGAHMYPTETEVVNKNVIKHLCACSGEEKLEPSLFFGQLDIMLWANARGMDLIHSQVIPMYGQYNFKFGEDFNNQVGPPYLSGAITVIAQKN